MKDETSRINSRVAKSTKTRWENFLLMRHSTVRGAYGPELDKAMNLYMNSFSDSDNVVSGIKIHKTRLAKLKIISSAFRDLPTFPNAAPNLMETILQRSIPDVSPRTFSNYKQIVLDHKTIIHNTNGITEFNMERFCDYVDMLVKGSFNT